jgi:hypothetical protein
LEDNTMTLIEEGELKEISGANTQQDVVDFVERVLRESQRTMLQDTDPSNF